MIDLTPIVNAFITLIGLLLTTFLIPWIRTKISNEKLKEIQKWTSVGVKAAEMIYTESGMGDAKKKYVRKFLESKGYKLDIETVDALIEATVRDMQQEAFEVAELPGEDDEDEEKAGGHDGPVQVSALGGRGGSGEGFGDAGDV